MSPGAKRKAAVVRRDLQRAAWRDDELPCRVRVPSNFSIRYHSAL
jgi:hypothetical protein